MLLSLSKFKTTFQVPEAQPANHIPFIHRSTKKKKKNTHTLSGPVWYMCLKTENCCLKTFVEIRVGEKVY